MPQGKDTKRLTVYLTEDELQAIRVAAAYAGKSMASYAKERLVEEARRAIQEQAKP
jgi:uncharacterized protein (DUF1778 family)